MNEIIVIGTQPPCPRCKLLTELTSLITEQLGLSANVRHIAYSSNEAALIAQAAGLVPGTAKDVAKKAGINVDWSNVFEESNKEQFISPTVVNPNFKQYDYLIKEVAKLDNILRPYENIAVEHGIMMTPVLVIDGMIIHQGCMPDPDMIQKWLADLL